MPNAVTVLTNDHQTVEKLFSAVEGQAQPPQDVVDQIIKELSVHDAIEKEYFYPTVRDRLSAGDRLAGHSEDEHNVVARTLLDIDKATNGSPQEVDGLAKLIRLVREHVQEEEQQIFPALQSACSDKELDDLGAQLESAKKAAPTRPHPMAPSEGAGTKVAGAVSAPMDRLRDRMENR